MKRIGLIALAAILSAGVSSAAAQTPAKPAAQKPAPQMKKAYEQPPVPGERKRKFGKANPKSKKK